MSEETTNEAEQSEDQRAEEFVKRVAGEGESQKFIDKISVDFIKKSDLAEQIASIKQDNEEIRQIILKGKAQGKATIEEKDTKQVDKLKKLYEGIIDIV